MAYPEPIPEIKGREAKEFIKRLENFDLTDEQKEFYKDAVEFAWQNKTSTTGRLKYG